MSQSESGGGGILVSDTLGQLCSYVFINILVIDPIFRGKSHVLGGFLNQYIFPKLLKFNKC
jgi:hypothetical protein